MKTIITIGRQFGSGGKEIGIRVAKELGIPFYDKELLQEAAKKSGLCQKIFENFDERPKSLLYAIAMDAYPLGFSGTAGESLEQQVHLAIFKTIRNIAAEGPCVIIGRCADYALAEDPNLLSLFISAPLEDRIARVAKRQKVTPEEAKSLIQKTDKRRASYCEYYASKKWGADPQHGGSEGASHPQPHGGRSHSERGIILTKGYVPTGTYPFDFFCGIEAEMLEEQVLTALCEKGW